MKAILLTTILSLSIIVSSAKDFYIANIGNDNNPGTQKQPFATISHAKEMVREWNRTNRGENITVWLAGGEYRLSETLVFGMEDGAKTGQMISYSAIPGEKPVISSDVSVMRWERLNKMPKGLPKESKGKVWVAKVPDNVKSFNALYNSQQMLPRAKTKGMPHLRKVDSKENALYNTIPLDKDIIKEMFNPKNAEIKVIPGYAWVMNILPVKSVDFANGMVSLEAQSTYPLSETHYFPKAESIWVENTFAGLDSPGEWVFDQEAKLLYYWPIDNKKPGDDIVMPGLVEMLRVEGKIDYDGLNDIPVYGLCFNGITFMHGNRFEASGQTGLGLQHDWERFDAATALVRFRGAENCIVDHCTFINSGGAGIRLDLYAQNIKVINNDLSELGGGGVLLAGYGPGTKDVNKNNEISNNYIHHIGLLWTHSLGIWLWQSGHNLVSHNTIHDVPYTAIAVTGRINWDKTGRGECSRTVRWSEIGEFTGKETWVERERFLHGRQNRIEDNDLHHLMTVMNDGNGIYISGAGKGNIMRRNYVHDTPQQAAGEALRCDDDQNDVLIEYNVVFRFHTFGTGICSKGCNHIINNIVASPPGKVERGMLSLEPNYTPNVPSKLCAGSLILHNIFYAIESNQPFVYMDIMANTIDNINTDSNIYFNSSDPKAADDYFILARKYGNEVHSISSDPLFRNVSIGDFRLEPNSPALKLGFRPFELKAGRIK
ncbi:MAG: right-handed parallel beta-helix repeat-containing protein [Prolixibacteraceae bacterium]|jgi:hypothetical protein|nr:right-handed parallel beta-helix repeat-containing protein [Prolixibacteraceae bacterium]